LITVLIGLGLITRKSRTSCPFYYPYLFLH